VIAAARVAPRLRWWWPPVAILLAATATASQLRDVERDAWTFVLGYAVGFLALLWLMGAARGRSLSPAILLGVAVVLRLLVLPMPPTLSDDLYRYVWDGRMILAGINPYSSSPDDESLRALRDDDFERIAHRDVETVYPPLALVLFSIASALPHPFLAYKVLLALLDLGGCALLVVLARRLERPTLNVVWYAWSPLAVFEGAGMGHVDAAGVPFVVACVLLLEPTLARPTAAVRHRLVAGLAAAAGVLIKLVPLVTLPLWLRFGGRRFALAAAGAIAIGLGGAVWSVGGMPPGLVRYGVSWEFNGFIFEPFWRLLRSLEVDRAIKALLAHIEDASGQHQALDPLYPLVYPQLMAKLALGLALVVLVALVARKALNLCDGTRRILGGAVLLTATAYPWYFLWVLPFAALERAIPWLVLSYSLHFSYLPRFFGVSAFPASYLLVWGPFVIAAFLARALPSKTTLRGAR
jgi:hypothetical protein